MNEKIKLRDNGKLLVRLSLILNIIILLAKVGIVVYLIVSKNKLIENASSAAESGEGSIMLIGVFGFLVAFMILGVIMFIFKALFSAITIMVGIRNKFNKTYSSLSLVTAIFNCFHAFPVVMSVITEGANYTLEMIINYIILSVVMVGFASFNTTIQTMLLKYNNRHELEELQNGSNDDIPLIL